MLIMRQFAKGLIAILGFVLAKMPHFLFYWLVCFFAWIAYIFDKRRYQNALANLNFVFKETYTQEQKHAIIKRCYQNFMFVILESIRLPYLNQEKYLKRFQFKGKEFLFDLLEQNKKVVLVSAHYGYWESLGTAIPLQMQKELDNYANYHMYSLGRLTGFDFVNEMIINRREIFGVKLINKNGAFKQLFRIYAHEILGTGILVDQNISIHEGIEIEFFGKRATQTTIASVISRRFDAYLVPILIDFNQDYSKYTIHIYEAFKTAHSANTQEDILQATKMQAKIIEEKIKENPSSWFWFHKRWKTFYPEIYL